MQFPIRTSRHVSHVEPKRRRKHEAPPGPRHHAENSLDDGQKIREGWKDGSRLTGEVEIGNLRRQGTEQAPVEAAARRTRTGRRQSSVRSSAFAKPIPNTDEATLMGFVAETVSPQSTIYTDGSTSYTDADGTYTHQAVRHSVGEYVRGQSPHQRDRIVLEHAQAGAHGHVPQAQPQASAPLRDRVRRTQERPPRRYDHSDVRLARGLDGKLMPWKRLTAGPRVAGPAPKTA